MNTEQRRQLELLVIDLKAVVRVKRVWTQDDVGDLEMAPHIARMLGTPIVDFAIITYVDAVPGVYDGELRQGRDQVFNMLLVRVDKQTLTVRAVEDDLRRFEVSLRSGLYVVIAPHVIPLATGTTRGHA